MENVEQIIEETVVDEVAENAVAEQGICLGDVLFVVGVGALVVFGGYKLYKNVIEPKLKAKKEAEQVESETSED